MSRLVLLGHITGAHGIRGEVVIRSYTATPEDIAAYGPLCDAAGARTFTLEAVHATSKGLVARVAGVADRTAAEALKGIGLHVARDRLPRPAEREYYHADLVGLAAVAPDGSALGEVVAVVNYGAGDLLEIRRAGSSVSEHVPFTDGFVPEVDLDRRHAVVVMPVLVEGDVSDDAADEPV